jgi:hypothetical protein
VCVCAFSLRREFPDMILGDKPIISKVVLSQKPYTVATCGISCGTTTRHGHLGCIATLLNIASSPDRVIHTCLHLRCLPHEFWSRSVVVREIRRRMSCDFVEGMANHNPRTQLANAQALNHSILTKLFVHDEQPKQFDKN